MCLLSGNPNQQSQKVSGSILVKEPPTNRVHLPPMSYLQIEVARIKYKN
jgi:hypothetical protein